jgi:hypothetical protein
MLSLPPVFISNSWAFAGAAKLVNISKLSTAMVREALKRICSSSSQIWLATPDRDKA